MFSDAQKAALAAPLNRANVKSRQQGGRGVSYIEGWKAIEEANRIFGFDGWKRELVDSRCVSEREREIGTNKSPGWGVSYTAKVRVTVGDVTREGVGAGHGIDRDCGLAHESAIKEAETDAMKRALMTFGNPFGLALYDKEQTNVADEQQESRARFLAECNKTISTATDDNALKTWWNSEVQKNARRFFDMTAEEVNAMKNAVLDKVKSLTKVAA